MKHESHKQVPIKVTAYVDERIKELVEVLNTFQGVWTSESCQGCKGELAEVTFYYKARKEFNAIETFTFVNKLAETIKRVAIDEMDMFYHSIWLSLEWSGDFRIPCIRIQCCKSDVQDTVKILANVREILA
jgi:hypothetical protein